MSNTSSKKRNINVSHNDYDSDEKSGNDSELCSTEGDISIYETESDNESETISDSELNISDTDESHKIATVKPRPDNIKVQIRKSERLANKRNFAPLTKKYVKKRKNISDKKKATKPIKNKKISSRGKKKPNRKKVIKKRQYKDDSDASDIDLAMCSSADESSYISDSDESHKTFIDSIVGDLVSETYTKIQKKKADLRSRKWKDNLPPREIKKLDAQYKNICEIITKMPTIQELLKINMPLKSKCNLMEKLIILENVQPQTFEHLNLKTSINEELQKYKKSNLDENIYSKYTTIENKLENVDYVDIPIKYRVLGSNLKFANKVVLYNKFKYFSNLSDNSSEHPKLLNWLETILNLPTEVKPLSINLTDGNKHINKFLYGIKEKLDKEIYGMTKVKEQILFVLNSMIANPNSKGIGMALVGPQGVGKTELANVIAKAIDIPFVPIPLGGARDSSFLDGHSYTYEGSRPGTIVESIIKMKQLNGILFFDELDKISQTHHGEEISKLLLHITDSTQNSEFKDKYLGNEISIDLSNIWFIYSLNYIDVLDKTLRDRIPIINVDGYSKKEKIQIAKRHLIPNGLRNIGIKTEDISFTDEAIAYIIEKSDTVYNQETKSTTGKSGVRQLKHLISDTLLKINMIKNCILEDGSYGDLTLSYNIQNFKLPFIISKEHIENLNVIPQSVGECPMGMYM
jgi:ATP-dependent Lon protease